MSDASRISKQYPEELTLSTILLLFLNWPIVTFLRLVEIINIYKSVILADPEKLSQCVTNLNEVTLDCNPKV